MRGWVLILTAYFLTGCQPMEVGNYSSAELPGGPEAPQSQPEPSDPLPDLENPVAPPAPSPMDPPEEPPVPPPVDTPEEPSALPPPADEPKEIVYSDPITIRSGGTYSGNWQSLNSDIPAVRVQTSEPVIIENSLIRSRSHHIQAGGNVNLTVRNVRAYGMNPNVNGKINGRFLTVDTYRYVLVENSYMEDTAGMWFHNSPSGATVRLLKNKAKNIIGWLSDGQGGWQGDSTVYYVQFAQFDKGNNLVDTEIAWNEIINEPYKSRVEDVINFYKTSGSASSPVRVHNNYIQGAYPSDPVNGSFSGGGIMIGDQAGNYIHAYENQVVGTGNYGIAIAGGENNAIYDNRVVSCGKLSSGDPIKSANVGYYVWHYSTSYAFINNGGEGNYSGYSHPNGTRNDWWVPDAAFWTGNTRAPAGQVPCSMQDEEFLRWQQKRCAAVSICD